MKSLTMTRPSTARRGFKWRESVGAVATYIAVVTAVVIMLAPIVWLGITSIRPVTEITSVRLNLLPH